VNIDLTYEAPEKQPIAAIRAFIHRRGAARLAEESGICKRSLHYIARGDVKPRKLTRQRLEELMAREDAAREKLDQDKVA
jgi:hypothetical protein